MIPIKAERGTISRLFAATIIALSLNMVPDAGPTLIVNADNEGGLDLMGYCFRNGFRGLSNKAPLGPRNWVCVDSNNREFFLDLDDACRQTYGPRSRVVIDDERNVYSPRCVERNRWW